MTQQIIEINGVSYIISDGVAYPIKASDNKTTTTKKGKQPKTQPQEQPQPTTPKIPYSKVKDIIEKMGIDENIARFGILYNAENPYNISSKSVQKFYTDYNIAVYKSWYMPYETKDLINDKQLKQHSKMKDKNIKARIKILQEHLNKEHKNKTPSQVEKMQTSLNARIENLKGLI